MSIITLINQNIDPISWEDRALCDYAPGSHIHVWQININNYLPQIDELRNVLTPGEIARANRYLRSTDGDKFIVSRASLRRILSGYLQCAPGAINFKLTANNKPEIEFPSNNQIHFNLSDSADSVLIAVATSPVGIDVELINHKFSYHAILHNNFSLPEAAYIEQRHSHTRFFLLWTRKEAILKATGIGLTDHLKLIPSLDGEFAMEGSLVSAVNNWHLSSFRANSDYIATVANSSSKKEIRFFNF